MCDPTGERASRRRTPNAKTPNAEWWTVEQEQCIGRHVYYADLRVPVREVPADLRGLPIDEGFTLHRLSERIVPAGCLGRRKGQASSGHWSGANFQRVRFLHHRLQKCRLQGGG